MNPSPKLTDQEKRSIVTSFGSSYKYQSIQNNTKIILTHVLKRWNENKSSAHPITCPLISIEIVPLKIYFIELEYYSLSFVIYSESDALYVVIFPQPICFTCILIL